MIRKTSWLLAWLLTQAISAQAQNLVPNPGFETLIRQPCRIISNPFDDNIHSYALGWTSPTSGTADIHTNQVPTDSNCVVGLARTGYTAHSGRACAGLYTSPDLPQSTFANVNYREYIQCKLTRKLVPGRTYLVELYVIHYNYTSQYSLYSNNIGCYFSADSIYQPLTQTNAQYLLPFVSQVNESQVIQQSTQWHKISRCFRAQSADQFLTIGNFYSNQQTQFVSPTQGDSGGAYYLIDDISVTEVAPDQLPTLSLRDTVLCPAQQLPISLPSTAQYSWQDGTHSASYTIVQSGVYSVTASGGGCSVSDTFQVVQEPRLQLPPDTTICRDFPFNLTPLTPLITALRWSTGSTDATLTIRETGLYWVRSESATCPQIDSVRVTVLACPGVIPNVFTPNGDGLNDTFYIDGIELVPWRLEIYNRWGSRVYQSDNYQNDWAGDHSPTGTYYYLLSSETLAKQFKGWVQVMR